MNASLLQLSMEEEVSWCGETFQLLILVSCFTVKRILQKGLLPTIEKLFSKAEQLDVIFQQCS